MKSVFNFLFLIMICSCGPVYTMGQSFVETQKITGTNLLKSAAFENGFSPYWTLGSSVTSSWDYSDFVPPSKRAVTLSFTSKAGTIAQQTFDDCFKLSGQPLEYTVMAKTSTANLELCAVHDTTVMQCWPIDATGVFKANTLPGVAAPSANSCRLRIRTKDGTTSVTGSIKLSFGNYLGISRNIGSVHQATFFGGMEQAGASGGTCAYRENTSSGGTNYVSLSTGSGCNAWTTTGNVTATGTNDHRPVLNNVTAGTYLVKFTGQIFSDTTAQNCLFRLSDGTSTYQPQVIYSSAGSIATPALEWVITYSADQGSKTLTVQAADTGSGYCQITNDAAQFYASWKVFRFPSAAETVFRPSQGVDLTGGIILWDLSENCPANTVEVNGGTIPAQYTALIAKMGTSTNRDYQALVPRGIGTQSINGRTKTGPTAAGDKQEDQFQGHLHSLASAFSAGGAGGTASSNNQTPTGTVTTNSTYSVDGSNGTPRTGSETRVNSFGVKFCRIAWATPTPLISQSVVSSAAGVEVVNRALINCKASSVVSSQNGSWVSSLGNAVDTGSQRGCTITAATGTWSSSPSCTVTIGSNVPTGAAIDVQSATTIVVWGPDADYFAQVICQGPK